jgi:hypothetical protein
VIRLVEEKAVAPIEVRAFLLAFYSAMFFFLPGDISSFLNDWGDGKDNEIRCFLASVHGAAKKWAA